MRIGIIISMTIKMGTVSMVREARKITSCARSVYKAHGTVYLFEIQLIIYRSYLASDTDLS